MFLHHFGPKKCDASTALDFNMDNDYTVEPVFLHLAPVEKQTKSE